MTGRAPMLRLIAAWLLALAWLASPAGAEPTYPKFAGLVVDAAGALPPDRAAALEAKLAAFQARTNRQLAVAIVPDLQGYDIAQYGVGLLRAWGVGLKDANNGAILIVAPAERKVRIEVGYGLEPVLTDALSSVIVNQDITPRFKAGDMAGGIEAGVDAITTQLSLPDADARAKQDAAVAAWNKAHARGRTNPAGGAGLVGAVIIGVILLSVLGALRRRSPYGRGAARFGGSDWPIILWSIAEGLSNGRGGGGWGGGGDESGGGGWGGGGFTGGGGGSGGGGGASGSW